MNIIISAFGALFVILVIFDISLGVLMNISKVFRAGVNDGVRGMHFQIGRWKL